VTISFSDNILHHGVIDDDDDDDDDDDEMYFKMKILDSWFSWLLRHIM
jgi:hypothetical protein